MRNVLHSIFNTQAPDTPTVPLVNSSEYADGLWVSGF
jgi:hypothetical protein